MKEVGEMSLTLNILLINPLVESFERSEKPFPLGLGYIARVLYDEGYHIEVLDLNAQHLGREKTVSEIRKRSYDVCGISCMLTEYKQVQWLCSLIKKERPDSTLILGGGLPSVVPELVLNETTADIAVVGEGEETAKELMKALKESSNLSNIKGIWYKKEGRIYKNTPREPILSLDGIPFPVWEFFPTEMYFKKGVLGFDPPLKSVNMISSRGCSYACTYCDHSIFGSRYRARSANNILLEMRLLKERYKIKAIAFSDDLFLLDRNRVYEFCDKLKLAGLDMLWSCNGRVDLMDRGLLDKMRSAGCVMIGYGIESGSSAILKEMNKRVTTDQAKNAIRLTWEAGITPFPYMMFGMPSETETTIEETVGFCKEIGIVEGFGFAAPIPGTPLYEQARRAGKIPGVKELVEKWVEWGKAPILNLTSLPTDGLIALKEKAEKATVNHILKKHKMLVARRLYYYYRVHGLAALMRRLMRWGFKFVKRNFGKKYE